jgi:hypothetical protein
LNRFQIYKYEPTYLDICKYSGRRFEEIGSRILAFYFQPSNEHGLRILLIESLFEAIKYYQEYIDDNIQINTEENADGKRLDILIENNDWVIGIENKIWANVYNPLDKYKKRIEQYDKPNNFKILLSLHEITNKDELKNIHKNGFFIVPYEIYFDLIKKNIGKYISDANMKYIFFLYDFMQTLENMKGNNIMNKEMDAFFRENSERLDKLFDNYQEYKNKKRQIRIEKIREIYEKIVEITKNNKWAIYKGDDLWFSKNNHDIGIESWFCEDENDPAAYFQIYLTSWNAKSWNQYGEQLKKTYPKAQVELSGNRAYLNVYEEIDGHNNDEIITRLLECYKCIINLK